MGITNKGKTWELLNSLWILWTFTLFFSCVAYFWIGGRAGNRKWIVFGLVYLVVNLGLCFTLSWLQGVNLTLYYLTGVLIFIGFLAAIVQAFMVRKEYLIRREAVVDLTYATRDGYRDEIRREYFGEAGTSVQVPLQGSFAPGQAYAPVGYQQGQPQQQPYLQPMPVFQETNQQPLPVPQQGYQQPLPVPQQDNQQPYQPFQQPAPAQPLPQQPPLYPPSPAQQPFEPSQTPPSPLAVGQVSQTAPKVDLNRCSEQELADLPGVGIALAKRALEMRSQAGGFMSVQDFCQRMGLMPHFAVQIEGRAFATANPSNGSPSKGAARVVDI